MHTITVVKDNRLICSIKFDSDCYEAAMKFANALDGQVSTDYQPPEKPAKKSKKRDITEDDQLTHAEFD